MPAEGELTQNLPHHRDPGQEWDLVGKATKPRRAVGRGRDSEKLWSGQGSGEPPADCLWCICLSVHPMGHFRGCLLVALTVKPEPAPLDLNFRGTRCSPAVSPSPD